MTPRRIRLRRTALFLFGSLALVLSACGDDDDTGLFQGTGGGSNDNGSGGSLLGKGGSGNAGTSAKGGSDAGGSSSKGGSAGKGGTSSKGGTGGTAGVGGKGGSSSGSGGAGGDEPAGGNGGDAAKGGSENPAGAGGSGGSSGQGGVGASGGTGGKAGAGGATGGKAGAGGAGANGGSASGNGGASSGSGGTAAGNGGSASGAAGNGSGAAGASAGSGGVGGSPYTGAIVPTTCAEAHGFPGCCGPDGKTIYYFDKGKVEQTTCENAGNVCGWNDSVKYYDCQPSTKVDPTNKYPLRCGGEPVEGACSSGGAGAGGGTAGGGGANGDGIPETCSEAHGTFGCCVGDTLYTGNVLTATPQSCAATGQKCGWNNSTKRYACGTGTASDPTSTYARACFGPFTGGGCLN